MKKLSLFIIGGLLFTAPVLRAQDGDEMADMDATEDKPLSITGSVDTYYRTTLNTEDNGGSAAPSTSFNNQTGFALGMVNLIAEKEGEKSGFVADLVFGPRGNQAVFGSDPSTGSSDVINQLYAWWAIHEKVTLTIGNFNTFLGYEVISPTGNFNYSTSYAFSYGPFSHTGIKADISLTDELSLMLGALNPTDYTDFSPISNMTFGAQLGYSNDQGGVWLNFLQGNQDVTDDGAPALTQIDLTTGWDVTDAFYAGLNFTVNSTPSAVDGDDASSYLAAGLYLQYSLSDDFALGFRGEYLAESNGGYDIVGGYNTNLYDTDGNASIIDLTLSANYKVGDLTLIPEVRIDMISENEVGGVTYNAWSGKPDSDGVVEGTNSLISLGLAAVYAF